MNVLETKTVEECIEGVVVREVVFDAPVEEDFIRSLEKLGRLEYFPHFPKPFFRVRKSGQYVLKGVQGNRTCQIFYMAYREETERSIYDHFHNFTDREKSP